MVFDLVLKHCVYIFLHTSSAQVLNSMFVDKHGQGKGGVLENKTKGRPKNSNCGGKTSMHKLTSLLDFFKTANHPPSGGLFTTYGILLCYVSVNVTGLLY